MSIGRQWPLETKNFTDNKTGAQVRQLTDYKGHSNHFYFTNPGWYDDGKKLLFTSDRENRTNLFSVNLNNYEITQLTDLKPVARDNQFEQGCLNPKKPEVYFWYGQKMMALDLQTGNLRELYELSDDFGPSIINCTADGQYVCGAVAKGRTPELVTKMMHGYVGFREYCETKPLCRVLAIATDGSGTKTIWEEKCWFTHVNTSPTLPHILTFCHEGPWALVDHRIWGLNIETEKAWKIRPCEPGQVVGHEYWYADGERLGYHGRNKDGSQFFGQIHYDNTERSDVDFPHQTGHIHSNDEHLIVGDAGKVIRLWKWNGTQYDGPRICCEHRCSKHMQRLHVHPRFSPDGKQILFTSDMWGYGNVYLVDVPEFESLPEIEE
jgi:oligogalacturonide lyase